MLASWCKLVRAAARRSLQLVTQTVRGEFIFFCSSFLIVSTFKGSVWSHVTNAGIKESICVIKTKLKAITRENLQLIDQMYLVKSLVYILLYHVLFTGAISLMMRGENFLSCCRFHNYESIPFSARFHTLIDARKKSGGRGETFRDGNFFVRFIHSWAAQLCEWIEWMNFFLLFTLSLVRSLRQAIHKESATHKNFTWGMKTLKIVHHSTTQWKRKFNKRKSFRRSLIEFVKKRKKFLRLRDIYCVRDRYNTNLLNICHERVTFFNWRLLSQAVVYGRENVRWRSELTLPLLS